MPTDFQQIDTAAPLGAVVACSGLTIGSKIAARLATALGEAGVGTPQFGAALPQSADEAMVMFEVDPGEDVPTGDHIMRLSITTTNTALTWTECHVCWWNGASYSSLGSVTGIGHVLDTVQTETATISSASASPTYSAGDRLYYVLVFDATGAHGSANANFAPSEVITTPIEAGAGLGMPLVMHHRKQMAGSN